MISAIQPLWESGQILAGAVFSVSDASYCTGKNYWSIKHDTAYKPITVQIKTTIDS